MFLSSCIYALIYRRIDWKVHLIYLIPRLCLLLSNNILKTSKDRCCLHLVLLDAVMMQLVSCITRSQVTTSRRPVLEADRGRKGRSVLLWPFKWMEVKSYILIHKNTYKQKTYTMVIVIGSSQARKQGFLLGIRYIVYYILKYVWHFARSADLLGFLTTARLPTCQHCDRVILSLLKC